MKDWSYSKSGTRVVLPSEPKQKLKVTGTRFATILGFNDWSTPFEAWCEITKTAKKPFEGNKYTEAGKTIEPKVIEYCKEKVSPHVQSPQEWFGNTYEEVKYDFFPNVKIYGGMWDAVVTNRSGDKIRSIIEIKTTKRAEDWVDHPPTYYLLQACLYAYLVGVDQVIMCVSFLDEDDYKHPEKYVVGEDNTKIFIYSLSELRFTHHEYSFTDLIAMANNFYDNYVRTGESPEFDEKKDEEILKILRTMKPANDNTLDDIIMTLNQKEAKLSDLKKESGIDDLEKEIKALKEAVKKDFLEKIGDSDKLVYNGWSLSRGKDKETVDIEALKNDGLDKYITITKGSMTLRKVSTK